MSHYALCKFIMTMRHKLSKHRTLECARVKKLIENSFQQFPLEFIAGIPTRINESALNVLRNSWNIIFIFQSPGEAAILMFDCYGHQLLYREVWEAWGGQWWVDCRIRDSRYGSLVVASGVTNNTTKRWKLNRTLNMPDADARLSRNNVIPRSGLH